VCVAVITAIVAFAPGKDAKAPPEAVVRSRIAPYMIDAASALTAAAPKSCGMNSPAVTRKVKRSGRYAETRDTPRLPESEVSRYA